MQYTSITYRTLAEKHQKIPARRGWLIQFITSSKAHCNDAGTVTVQSSENYALIIDRETKELVKLQIDSNKYEIRFSIMDDFTA